MSKEDNHIDNLFKEKLDGRSFDGPPADFLADLNQRLDAKPVVSKSWIWMIFLNLFIIGLFIANASIDSTTSKSTEVSAQLEEKEQHSTQEESFKAENGQKKNTLVKANETQTDDSKENENLDNAEIESNGLESNQTDLSSEESIRVQKNEGKKNGTDSNTLGNTVNKSESAKTSNNTNGKRSKTKTTSNTSGDSNNSDSNQASKKSNDARSNRSENKQKINLAAGDIRVEENKDKTDAQKLSSNKGITPINGSESLSSYVSYSAIYAPQFEEVERKITSNDFPNFPSRWNELVAENNSKPTEKAPKKEKDTDKRMFEIQFQGGATQWSFKARGTNDEYVNLIDQSGTPKWTPNFGLGFNVNFNKISIGTGVNYAKFKTENLFEFSEVNVYDSTYIAGYDANVTYDSLGNPIDTTYTPYYDSTTVSDSMSNSIQITNQYEWIQIPIHFGYRFNLNKWAIIPRVGVNIGIGIRQTSGQYPNEAYDNLQTIDPVKWNLNLHTSLEVRRDFGNWHAFGKFNYQRNLTPTIDNTLFERKFNGIGFSFGVGYSF